MKLGVLLSSFAQTPDLAIEEAIEAEASGLHGVFCFDHLWPMGDPGSPAISPYPLLAAVATETDQVMIGTLVARVGLEPDEVLVAELETLEAISGGRLIAGIGTGDHKSTDENVAFGIEPLSADERRASLERVALLLRALGVEVWIGGGSRATNELAVRLGVTLNLWAGGVERIAAVAARSPVSWGGQLPSGVEAAAAKLRALDEAGASWAAISWKGPYGPLVEVAARAGIALAR